jgi:uncharacterized protein YggE
MRVSLCVAVLAVAALPLAASAQPKPPPNAINGTTAILTGQGVVTRPADSATISLAIATSDDVAEAAAAKSNAVYDALKSKVAPLGTGADKVKTTYYNLIFNPRPADGHPPTGPVPVPYQPRYGYVVTRQVQVVVPDVTNTGKVVDAAIAAGVTNVNGVSYALSDRRAANDAALAAAFENAATQAASVATASHMRIAGIKQIQVGAANTYPVPPMMLRFPPGAQQSSAAELPPATVEVRATVTVTYLLK